MSGKALEGKVSVSRLKDRDEWLRIGAEVQQRLGSNTDTRQLIVSPYHIIQTIVLLDKNLSHGDVDFVVEEQFFNSIENVEDKISTALDSKAYVRNGDVVSFEYKGFQIDFICVPSGTSGLHSKLYGHGGAGYLARYIGRSYGVYLSNNGLNYEFKDGDTLIEKIFLTKERAHVFNFLGLNPLHIYGGRNSFTQGFLNLEQAYRHISSSYLFTLSDFDIDNNFEYVGKRERLEYAPFAGFVEWIKQTGLQNRAQGLATWKEKPDQLSKKSLQDQLKAFYGFEEKCKLAYETYLSKKLLRRKFSGEIVMEVTGLQAGPDLGKFMEWYKKSFGSQGKFEFFMLSSGAETIRNTIKVVYEMWMNRVETERVAEALEGKDLTREILEKGEKERHDCLSALGLTQPGYTRQLIGSYTPPTHSLMTPSSPTPLSATTTITNTSVIQTTLPPAINTGMTYNVRWFDRD